MGATWCWSAWHCCLTKFVERMPLVLQLVIKIKISQNIFSSLLTIHTKKVTESFFSLGSLIFEYCLTTAWHLVFCRKPLCPFKKFQNAACVPPDCALAEFLYLWDACTRIWEPEVSESTHSWRSLPDITKIPNVRQNFRLFFAVSRIKKNVTVTFRVFHKKLGPRYIHLWLKKSEWILRRNFRDPGP